MVADYMNNRLSVAKTGLCEQNISIATCGV
jgi:hypothetical protein